MAAIFIYFSRPRLELDFLITTQILFALSIAIFLVGRPLVSDNRSNRMFWTVIIFSLAVRLAMLLGSGSEFQLSDDVYRYIWDGKVIANGINPYLYAPNADALAPLRDTSIWPNINHAYLPTIYPPLAQLLFLFSYLIGGGSVWGFKIVSALFELASIVLLLHWFKKTEIDRGWILLWLFSPLILIEFFFSAHVDILAMPFFVLALLFVGTDKPVATGLTLALASMVKLFGLFLVPILFFYWKGKQRVGFALACAGTILVMYIPFLVSDYHSVLGSLANYLAGWEYYGSIFILLKSLLSAAVARIIVASTFLIWLIIIIFRPMDVFWKFVAVFAAYFVLTPTFFPWYLVWILPLLFKRHVIAFFLLTGTILLSYNGHDYIALERWTPLPGIAIAVYASFFIVLVWELFRSNRRGIA